MELQGRIDEVLRRRLSPPAELVIPGFVADAGAAARGGGRRWWIAAAAAVALLAAGSWWGLQQMGGGGEIDRVYAQQVAAGLRPQWVCGTDEEMVQYLANQFGQGLYVRGEAGAGQDGTEVRLIGWTSAPLLSAYTSVLLARVEGEPVLVLVDQAGEATTPEPPGRSSGLRLFRREVEGLVLYEVTPRESPAILDRFAAPTR